MYKQPRCLGERPYFKLLIYQMLTLAQLNILNTFTTTRGFCVLQVYLLKKPE